MTDTHVYHKTLGLGPERQCYVVEAKSYGGSIGVRENFLRKCVDPTHAQGTVCPCHAHDVASGVGYSADHRCTPLCSHSILECVEGPR